MNMNNKIVLRSVYGKVVEHYFITPCKDPKTGRYPDCVRPIDSNGDMILSEKDKQAGTILIPRNKVFEVMDGTEFDLTDPWQAAEWESIKYAPIIAPSRDARDNKGNLLIDGAQGQGLGQLRARYGNAELYIETPDIDTSNRVNRKRKIHDAETYVYNDERGAEGRRLKARLMGKNMKNASDNEVIEFLIEIADKNPEKIINLYTGSDTNLRILLIDARERGVIVVKNKVYMYGDDVILGTTDDGVIAYFKEPKNANILKLIMQETYPEMEVKKEKKTK